VASAGYGQVDADHQRCGHLAAGRHERLVRHGHLTITPSVLHDHCEPRIRSVGLWSRARSRHTALIRGLLQIAGRSVPNVWHAHSNRDRLCRINVLSGKSRLNVSRFTNDITENPASVLGFCERN
jgi:hypothetical protein